MRVHPKPGQAFGVQVTLSRLALRGRPARQMLDGGESTITEIASTIGVGRATLYRHLDLPKIG